VLNHNTIGAKYMELSAQTDSAFINDEAEIRQIELDWGNAYLERDLSKLNEIMADSYVLTDPLGEVTGKHDNLEAIAAREVIFQSTVSDGVRVHVHENTAVVTARSTFRGSYKGWPIGGSYQYTDVFAKINGRWQAIASQLTLVGGGYLKLMAGRFITKQVSQLRSRLDRFKEGPRPANAKQTNN
jgi:ketosteroid isomerase-like protein